MAPCKTCRFWVPLNYEGMTRAYKTGPIGECRHHSPGLLPTEPHWAHAQAGAWPLTFDGCGDHQLKTANE